MSVILLVTGNKHKLLEWQRMMPSTIELQSLDLDLEELQSDDTLEIVTDKVKRAYATVGKPVIVEDVSAGLVDLQGLPGPFIKFFIKRLGQDALYQLAGKQDGAAAIVSCAAAYYDGDLLLTAHGEVEGKVVAPRGESFGFDVTFVPNGHTQTYAEMERSMKDSLSHRSIAVTHLLNTMREKNLLG